MLFNSKMFLSKTLFYVILITHFIQTTTGKNPMLKMVRAVPMKKKCPCLRRMFYNASQTHKTKPMERCDA